MLDKFANESGTFSYNETAGEYRRDGLVGGRQHILYLNHYKISQPGWILADEKKKKKKALNPVKYFIVNFPQIFLTFPLCSGLCCLSGADWFTVEILEQRLEGIRTL